MRIFQVIGLLVAITTTYLALWPVPIDPVAWHPSGITGGDGPRRPNHLLAAAKRVPLGGEIGPEHIAVGPDGRLYTGTLSGTILRTRADGTGLEVFARTGGRPLGMDFDAAGNLIVADAFRGLLSVHRDGGISVLIDRLGDDLIEFADAVVVASDGRILFTDASHRFPARRWGTFDAALLDVMEHSCTGRVIEYEPESQRARTVMRGLCFANGIALSTDQRQLFISETATYRVWVVDRTASDLDAQVAERLPAYPGAHIFAADLPGFPDNLTHGSCGKLWLGFTKPRSAAVDALAAHPFLRRVTLRLPRMLWPVPPAYGRVVAFDEGGHVVADLQDPSGGIPETSGATEHDGRLYIQSLSGREFGILRLPDARR